MSISKGKIKMTFRCDQHWEDMEATACEKFCHIRGHEVFDYTKNTKSELEKPDKNSHTLCGLFNIEQIDDNIITPITLPVKIKTLGIFSSFFWSIATHCLFGQSQKTSPNPVSVEQPNHVKTNDSIPCFAQKYNTDITINQHNIPKKARTTHELKTRYFLTKKIPFIARVPPRITKRPHPGVRFPPNQP